MSIDKEKLKALAEAATQSYGARRVEVDHNGVHVIGDGSWKILSAWHTPDGKAADNAEFAAATSPATILALLAEIDQLAFEPAKHSRRLIDQLKAENEALRKAVKFSVDEFENITSGDGSGHADLARAVKRIAGVAFSEEKG